MWDFRRLVSVPFRLPHVAPALCSWVLGLRKAPAGDPDELLGLLSGGPAGSLGVEGRPWVAFSVPVFRLCFIPRDHQRALPLLCGSHGAQDPVSLQQLPEADGRLQGPPGPHVPPEIQVSAGRGGSRQLALPATLLVMQCQAEPPFPLLPSCFCRAWKVLLGWNDVLLDEVKFLVSWFQFHLRSHPASSAS